MSTATKRLISTHRMEAIFLDVVGQRKGVAPDGARTRTETGCRPLDAYIGQVVEGQWAMAAWAMTDSGNEGTTAHFLRVTQPNGDWVVRDVRVWFGEMETMNGRTDGPPAPRVLGKTYTEEDGTETRPADWILDFGTNALQTPMPLAVDALHYEIVWVDANGAEDIEAFGVYRTRDPEATAK